MKGIDSSGWFLGRVSSHASLCRLASLLKS
jgi:hypothetical protein